MKEKTKKERQRGNEKVSGEIRLPICLGFDFELHQRSLYVWDAEKASPRQAGCEGRIWRRFVS